jgi:DNA-binding PadR family transcriptional regulator
MNDLMLLSALLRGPTYGYALKKTAGLIFGSRAMHPNVVYPLLRNFTENGWVEQTSRAGEKGQTRKQYRITADGKSHLFEKLAKFKAEDAGDDGAFLFRVALFDAMSKESRKSVVAARKSFLTARAEQLDQLEEATQPSSFGATALARVKYLVQDELRWISDIENEIQAGKGDPKCKPVPTHRATVRRS